jgi:hypothetical protein
MEVHNIIGGGAEVFTGAPLPDLGSRVAAIPISTVCMLFTFTFLPSCMIAQETPIGCRPASRTTGPRRKPLQS